MSVKGMSISEFDAHLDQLGLRHGMHVAVHSRLLTFGRIEGGAAAVFEVLRERVGEAGTLAFPTYTLNLGIEDVYDRMNTPSFAMGALSEYSRKQPGVQRTDCPMHGHTVIGVETDALLEADHLHPMGPGSAFQAMRERDFHLLLLGCSFHEGATFIHHVEAMHGVPYREWLALPRSIYLEDGSIHKASCRYYGRKQDIPWTTDLRQFEESVSRDGLGARLSIRGRTSYLMPLTKLEDYVSKSLDRQPYALMRRKPSIDTELAVDNIA